MTPQLKLNEIFLSPDEFVDFTKSTSIFSTSAIAYRKSLFDGATNEQLDRCLELMVNDYISFVIINRKNILIILEGYYEKFNLKDLFDTTDKFVIFALSSEYFADAMINYKSKVEDWENIQEMDHALQIVIDLYVKLIICNKESILKIIKEHNENH